MNSTPITIEVDSEIESIVPEFLENRVSDCVTIGLLLENSDFSGIRTLGHRMKGSGGSYGFDTISEIGEGIEAAALTGDREAIRDYVVRLSEYLGRVKVVYV